MLTLLLNQLAEDIQIEAVLHGKGLGLLLRKSSAMRDRLKQAAASGVKSPIRSGPRLNEAALTDNCFFGGVLFADGPWTIVSDQPA
jgi:hypothetical protein